MSAANERQTTKKEKAKKAANARWGKQNKDDATSGETIAHDMGFGTAAGQMVASAISSSRLGHS
jgi:hypothetical protein